MKGMKKKWNKDTILAGVGLPGKIDDIPELKEELVTLFLTKSHKAISRYSLLLAEHILKTVNRQPTEVMRAAFEINLQWQEGNAKFQEARNAADKLLKTARAEKDPVTVKLLRFMAQVANTPHVPRHALIASDYAIALINVMRPHDLEAVRKERVIQIELMKEV
jgi:hypothetical protein